jgi:hypothetical protein
MSAAAMTSSPKTAPSLQTRVRGQYGRRVLVAARHQLKEEHRAGAADREIADLVEDEDSMRRMNSGVSSFKSH